VKSARPATCAKKREKEARKAPGATLPKKKNRTADYVEQGGPPPQKKRRSRPTEEKKKEGLYSAQSRGLYGKAAIKEKTVSLKGKEGEDSLLYYGKARTAIQSREKKRGGKKKGQPNPECYWGKSVHLRPADRGGTEVVGAKYERGEKRKKNVGSWVSSSEKTEKGGGEVQKKPCPDPKRGKG